jgi:hypothetical protein
MLGSPRQLSRTWLHPWLHHVFESFCLFIGTLAFAVGHKAHHPPSASLPHLDRRERTQTAMLLAVVQAALGEQDREQAAGAELPPPGQGGELYRLVSAVLGGAVDPYVVVGTTALRSSKGALGDATAPANTSRRVAENSLRSDSGADPAAPLSLQGRARARHEAEAKGSPTRTAEAVADVTAGVAGGVEPDNARQSSAGLLHDNVEARLQRLSVDDASRLLERPAEDGTSSGRLAPAVPCACAVHARWRESEAYDHRPVSSRREERVAAAAHEVGSPLGGRGAAFVADAVAESAPSSALPAAEPMQAATAAAAAAADWGKLEPSWPSGPSRTLLARRRDEPSR